MASPPPGGPQTPQQPYPQQPYPQQPYPPQYPPQQPYYQQPMAPPPKKSNTVLIVVIVVVVVVVALAAVAWYAFTLMVNPVNATATITGVDFTIQYSGATQYFGGSSITTCTSCPLHPTVTSPVPYNLVLTNSDSVAHDVTSVTLTSFQFYLSSASPNPSSGSPVDVPAGGTVTIVLNIAATSLSGSGIVTGTIVTS